MVAHAAVSRRVLGHAQRQPLRLRLLSRLLARQRRCRRRRRYCPLRRRLPLRRPRDAQRRLLGGGEDAQVHVLATAPHPRLVGLGPAGLVVQAEVACLALGHAQRQPLRLRLLPRLLARQRWRFRRIPLRRRRPTLRRSSDAQRRLLGAGEAAQVHLLTTAPHLCLIGIGLAGIGEVHAEVARRVLGHDQRQILRLRLLPRLLARQRRRRCSPLRRRRPPLRRPREAQRRLLGGGEAAQAHVIATAFHPRRIGLGPAWLEVHAEVARHVLGLEQHQPLRRRLRAPHRRSPTRRDRRAQQSHWEMFMDATTTMGVVSILMLGGLHV
eukprot:scaffold14419_cov60-Phaeocystis_antarctica.AAC.3